MGLIGVVVGVGFIVLNGIIRIGIVFRRVFAGPGTSSWSSCAHVFGAGRVVAGMARQRLAPAALSRTVRGVPVVTTLAMLGVLVTNEPELTPWCPVEKKPIARGVPGDNGSGIADEKFVGFSRSIQEPR